MPNYLGGSVRFPSDGSRAQFGNAFRLIVSSGLAISGGADSMALAYLCRQLELSAESKVLTFTAFVVDHRARKESSWEASRVAGWLSQMGTC